MWKNLNTILVFGLVLFLGLGLVHSDEDAGKTTKPTVVPPPTPTTTKAPPTTTAGPTTTEKPDNLQDIFRFLQFGFSMYKQTFFNPTDIQHAVFNYGATKVEESCFNSQKVPVFVQDCDAGTNDIPRIYIHYNESSFRNLLDPTMAAQRALSYSDTLNLTSYYSRVYTEAIYYANRLVINVENETKLEGFLHASFKHDVQNLTKEQNKTKYDAFIDLYGTHYVANLMAGGYLRMEGLTEETEFEFEGEKEAVKIVNATILQFFEKNGRMHVPDEWVDATPKRVSYNGGDQNMGAIKFHTQAVQWLKTVGLPNYPLALNGARLLYLSHLFKTVNETYAKEKEDNFLERIEYHNKKYKLNQIVAGLQIARTDPNAKGTHGCFNTDLLYKYFDDLRNDEKFDEKMKTQEYLDREFCAISTLNYVALMRRFFHSFNDTIPGWW